MRLNIVKEEHLYSDFFFQKKIKRIGEFAYMVNLNKDDGELNENFVSSVELPKFIKSTKRIAFSFGGFIDKNNKDHILFDNAKDCLNYAFYVHDELLKMGLAHSIINELS